VIFGNLCANLVLSIGRKNFFHLFAKFTIMRKNSAYFISRQSLNWGDLTGIDAALGFSSFSSNSPGKRNPPDAVKLACAELRSKSNEVLSGSHGEVSSFLL